MGPSTSMIMGERVPFLTRTPFKKKQALKRTLEQIVFQTSFLTDWTVSRECFEFVSSRIEKHEVRRQNVWRIF